MTAFLDVLGRAATIYAIVAVIASILVIRPWRWSRDTRQSFWSLFKWTKS
ncbi:hypothetical protein D869_gp258 [Caulobacter phage CcrRogue]|uniref:Uncharacterized protein n=1 Tax=Caulobacter phage CcrRogue TaxID=2927986 RepID=K4JNS2_9CAUD|nr:hypothetical protein D869_gp258 [Caulobacter phage CcrRogue]AFU86656.1 hypothetical protein CcrRogue_gp174 [Caulobacter phage CcrRogue]